MRHAVVLLELFLLVIVMSARLYQPGLGDSTQIGYLYDKPSITFDTPEMDGTTIGLETTTGLQERAEGDIVGKAEDYGESRKKTLLT